MRVVLLIILMLSIAVPSMAVAQEDMVTTDLSGAFEVTVPEDWTDTGQQKTGMYWKTADSLIRIRTYSPGFREWYDESAELDSFLEYIITDVYDNRTFDTEAIENVSFEEYDGIAYTTEINEAGNRFDRRVMLYMLENDFIVLGFIQPLEGSEINPDDVAAMQAAMATVTPRSTIKFFEGTELDIPDGWELWKDHNSAFPSAGLRNDNLVLDFFLRPRYGEMAGFEKPADVLAYVVVGVDRYEIDNWDPNLLEDIRLAGFDGALYPYNTDHVNSWGRFNRAIIILNLTTNDTVFEMIVSSTSVDDSLEPAFDVLDSLRPGRILTCPLFADPGTRIRAEATISSDVVRATGDETLIALARFTDSAGYDWFDIGEGWIRSDVIYHEVNACQGIPIKR